MFKKFLPLGILFVILFSTAVLFAPYDREFWTGTPIRLDDSSTLILGSHGDFTVGSASTATMTITPLATDESPIINLGADQTGIDLKLFGATGSNYALWDASADGFVLTSADILFDDASYAYFGTGKDFSIISSTTKILNIAPAAATDDYQVLFGSDQTGVDLGLYGATASHALLWDASGNELIFTHTDLRVNDDGFVYIGTDKDFSLASSTNKILSIQPLAATDDYQILIGADQAGVDLGLFGATTAITLLWDASDNRLEFADSAILGIGTGNDFVVSASGTTTTATIAAGSVFNISDTDNAASKVTFGVAGGTHGLDVTLQSITAGDLVAFDAGAKTFTLTDIDLNIVGTTTLSFAGATPGAETDGSLISTGSTWVNHTAAGACAVKLLCSNSSTTGDYATLRIRGRSGAAGVTEGGNFSASGGINNYGNLCAGYFAAQPDAYTQSGASNIVNAIHGVIDATASSSGRRWVAWFDTHETTKASAGDYLVRLSHNGTIANDGAITVYTGGRMPVLFNFEDAAGFLTDSTLALTTQSGAIAVSTPAGTKYIALYDL